MMKDFRFVRRNSSSIGNNENMYVNPSETQNPTTDSDPVRPPFNPIQDPIPITRRKPEPTGTPSKNVPFRTLKKSATSVSRNRFRGAPADNLEETSHHLPTHLPPFNHYGTRTGTFIPRTFKVASAKASSVHSESNSTHSTPYKSVTKPGYGLSGSRPPVSAGIRVGLVKGLPICASPVTVVDTPDVPHFELTEDPSFWLDHNVQVVIRVRPVNSNEKSLCGFNRCLKQESNQTITWIGQPETRFMFDYVACETINQEMLFRVTGLPMVENCMSGYNSCMFAYGQTGSGKTYTMLGEISNLEVRPSPDRGMTPRIFEFLFARIRAEEKSRRDEKLRYSCKCSFLEIYNEHITDLLDPSSTNLPLREDVRKGVYVENLTEFKVESVHDILTLIIQGSANRRVAATNMNQESSRSHSVFMCVIESRWEKDSTTNFRFARLNLVDLAGSERQKTSGAEGDRLKEAASINKSLSTLGHVIMVLSDLANGKQKHVPYRDSRLTFLLQNSLGGNSKTMIIANISPSMCSASKTLSTLKFAQRARLIQNNAIINEDISGDVLALQRQIRLLKEEVAQLKGRHAQRPTLLRMDDSGDSDEKTSDTSSVEKLENVVDPVNSDKRLSNGSSKSFRLSNKQALKLELREGSAVATQKTLEASNLLARIEETQETIQEEKMLERSTAMHEELRSLVKENEGNKQCVLEASLGGKELILQQMGKLTSDREVLFGVIEEVGMEAALRSIDWQLSLLENEMLTDELRELKGDKEVAFQQMSELENESVILFRVSEEMMMQATLKMVDLQLSVLENIMLEDELRESRGNHEILSHENSNLRDAVHSSDLYMKTLQEGLNSKIRVIDSLKGELLAIQESKEIATVGEHLQRIFHSIDHNIDLVSYKVNKDMVEQMNMVSEFACELETLEKMSEKLKAQYSYLLSELNRREQLSEGFLFDLRLLQESASAAKDEKEEEIEELTSALETLKTELKHRNGEIEDLLSEIGEKDHVVEYLECEISELKSRLETLNGGIKELEVKLCERNWVVVKLEEELLTTRDLIHGKSCCIEGLRSNLTQLTGELKMANALAEENEAVATEARQIAEERKVYAEEKEEEVKLLENSIQELEATICALESKVDMVKEEAGKQQMQKELEAELHQLRGQLEDTCGGDGKNQIVELQKNIEMLEKELSSKEAEIAQCKGHISELNMHSEAQAREYKQKCRELEAMAQQVKSTESTAPAGPLGSMNQTQIKGIGSLFKGQGSGSPFKYIGLGMIEQMNSEKDEDITVLKRQIEELESVASSCQKEIFMLNTQLAAVESMTHDVIRDLLGIKMDMASYASILDNCQKISPKEMDFVNGQETEEKEQEIKKLKKRLNEFIEERQGWIDEINQRQTEILVARVSAEKLRRREQVLLIENEMLKCLPEKVMKHFNNFVGKNLEFKCPSGDVWHFGLIRSGDKLVLQLGWSNFVSSNNVSQNDLLLFKLVSGSTFETRIFNPFGREKGGDFEGEGDEDEVQEGTMSPYSSRVKIVGGNGISAKPNPRKRCTEVHRLLSEEKGDFLDSEDKYEISPVKKMIRQEEETLEEARNNDLLVMEHQTLLENGTSKTMTCTENHSSQNQIGSGMPIDYTCGRQCWQDMSIEQKATANRLALKIQAGNPAFLHIIKQSYLIVIPTAFASDHLQEIRNQEFILCRPENKNTWPVMCYMNFRSNYQFQCVIRGKHLVEFIEKNYLKEDDICMFELAITGDPITFIVHVSRAAR